MLLKIYCENITVAFLNQNFLFFILFFLFPFHFQPYVLFLFLFLFFLLHTLSTISTPLLLSFSSSFSLIHQNVPGALSFSSSLSLSLFFFLLDSKTLSVIRKFSFPPSFKNIPRSSHLRVVAHLRPQPNLDGSNDFCLLSFFFFFFQIGRAHV